MQAGYTAWQQHNNPVAAAIRTQLSHAEDGSLRLNGIKSWATLSDSSKRMLICARSNAADAARPELKMLNLPVDRAGLKRIAKPPTSFTPEIGHCEIQLNNVEVTADELLPGDGYSDYVKPFRYMEDCNVNAGLVGHLLRLARQFNWPEPTLPSLCGLVDSLMQCGQLNADSSIAHLLFADIAQRLLPIAQPSAEHWQLTDKETQQRWQRDSLLASVAGKARAVRLQNALKGYL